MSMEPWYRRQRQRFLRELREMKSRHPRMRLELQSGWAGWQGFVVIRDTPHFIWLVYPPVFPMLPPLVWETEPFTGAPVDYRASGHQFHEGDLCLYTHDHGENGWKIEYTAADVLDRYARFRADAGAGQLLQRPLPRAATFVWNAMFWISPALAQLMTVPGAWGQFGARATSDERLWAVDKIAVHGLELSLDDSLEGWASCELSREHAGIWLRIEAEDPVWEHLEDAGSIQSRLEALLPASGSRDLMPGSVVLLSRDVEGRQQEVVAVRFRSVKPLAASLCTVRVASVQDEIFRRVDPVLGEREALNKACVVMVGLGSLGSHVATSLAKAGVANFVLYDPERLGPENVCRHVGDMADVGKHKCAVVAEAIRRRNPRACVHAYPVSPLLDLMPGYLIEGWQRFHAALETPNTLVVVTAAHGDVERAINALCVDRGVPVVYSSVLGDAEHGRVFRVMPQQTACYQCVLMSQEREPGRYRWFAGTEGREMPGVGAYEQPGIPGVGIDVEQVALLTARLALQTLGRMMPGEIRYPDEDEHHLLWTNRGGWGFDRPLQLHVERYPRLEDCEICGGGSNASFYPDEEAHLRALIVDLQRPERMDTSVPLIEGRAQSEEAGR